jgi:putative DNA primase/helicase
VIDSTLAELDTKAKKTTEPRGESSRDGLPRQLTTYLHIDGSGDYPSRSELLFAFLNAALRAGVSEDTIIAACLDPKYEGRGIYEHCVENEGEKYVKRQIEHALNDAPSTSGDKGKRAIRIQRGDLHAAVDATEKALIAVKRPVYFRAGGLVEPIYRFEKTAEANRDTLVTVFQKLNTPRLGYMTAKHAAAFQKYDARTKRWERIDPPEKVIEMLLSLGHWGFPTARGIINSPTMRPDGSLLLSEGYDEQTQLWMKMSGDIEMPPVPERPTKDDALAALKKLKALMAGFPFVDETALAVALAGAMTPVLRGAFEFSPMFFFRAPESGTGKTFLVAVISMIATGRAPAAASATEDTDEMEKRLQADAFEAKPILSLNNLAHDLDSALLCQMLTDGIISIRPFGRNDVKHDCDCRGITVFANGNNVRVVGDLVRRTLTAPLDANLEKPEERKFDFDPVEEVKAHRGEYLAAIFTIARAYIAAGCPAVKAAELNGFNAWSRIVRHPLIWLGCADPVESMADARQNDPQRDALRDRLEALAEAFGDKQFTAKEVVAKMQEVKSSMYGRPEPAHPELIDAFSGDGRQIFNTKKIGNQLSRDLDRKMGALAIRRVSQDAKHGHRYKVEGTKRKVVKAEDDPDPM